MVGAVGHGEPQPAIVRLASDGAFAGAVLDAGCGTGENALHVASLGLTVVGVDVAETALSIARAKATDRGINAEFVVADAFHLDRLDRVFETVLDCGLFHTFDRDERRVYVKSLASVTAPGGRVYVLCLSDVGPGRCGPHPVSEEELRAAFHHDSWSVASVSPDRIQARLDAGGAPAWLAKIERILAPEVISPTFSTAPPGPPTGPRWRSLSGLTIESRVDRAVRYFERQDADRRGRRGRAGSHRAAVDLDGGSSSAPRCGRPGRSRR